MSKCPNCNNYINSPVFRKTRSVYKWYELVGVDMVCPVCGVKLAYDLRSRLIATLGICVYIAGNIVKLLLGYMPGHDNIGLFSITIMGVLLLVSMLVRKLEIKL